jgi:hypothetical protein
MLFTHVEALGHRVRLIRPVRQFPANDDFLLLSFSPNSRQHGPPLSDRTVTGYQRFHHGVPAGLCHGLLIVVLRHALMNLNLAERPKLPTAVATSLIAYWPLIAYRPFSRNVC